MNEWGKLMTLLFTVGLENDFWKNLLGKDQSKHKWRIFKPSLCTDNILLISEWLDELKEMLNSPNRENLNVGLKWIELKQM